MLNMGIHEHLLCIKNQAFQLVKMLGKFKVGASFAMHRDDALETRLRFLQCDNIERMQCARIHVPEISIVNLAVAWIGKKHGKPCKFFRHCIDSILSRQPVSCWYCALLEQLQPKTSNALFCREFFCFRQANFQKWTL